MCRSEGSDTALSDALNRELDGMLLYVKQTFPKIRNCALCCEYSYITFSIFSVL